MPREGTGVFEDALADIAYLARSKNRLEILETLATGPHTSREVEEATGVSRSTLERITSELQQREWAMRTTDGEYVLTDTGERFATETGRYVAAIEAVESLGEAVAWLPTEELTVGLEHFREATVWGPKPNDVAAADTRIIDRMRRSDDFACLSNTAGTVGLETELMEGFSEGRLAVEHVITPGELAIYLDDAGRAARWKEYVEAGADVYCHEGRIPCNLVLVDEAVFLGDRRLDVVGLVESTNDTVRSWAGDVFETYRDEAEKLDPTAFNPEQSAIGENRQ